MISLKFPTADFVYHQPLKGLPVKTITTSASPSSLVFITCYQARPPGIYKSSTPALLKAYSAENPLQSLSIACLLDFGKFRQWSGLVS